MRVPNVVSTLNKNRSLALRDSGVDLVACEVRLGTALSCVLLIKDGFAMYLIPSSLTSKGMVLMGFADKRLTIFAIMIAGLWRSQNSTEFDNKVDDR